MQPFALQPKPRLELQAIAGEAGQKLAGVVGHRCVEVARLDRSQEAGDIQCVVTGAVELHRLARDYQVRGIGVGCVVQQLPQLVERLAQIVVGGVGGLVGPEEGGQHITGDGPFAVQRQIDQQAAVVVGAEARNRTAVESNVKCAQDRKL